MEVVPAINCVDAGCVRARLKLAEDLGAASAHLDVTDGVFTLHRSWNDPAKFSEIARNHPDLAVEVHLMVKDPVAAVRAWGMSGARRLIVHVETLTPESFETLASECARHDVELGVALCPETPVGEVISYLGEVLFIALLAVPPGPSGQAFDNGTFEKLEFLRDRAPEATIAIDGGVTPDLARRLKEAGADVVVSGSYIFNAKDPHAAYQELLDA